MKAPHLLRVEEGPERFAELVAAARAEKLRVGWLELAAGDRTEAAGDAVPVAEGSRAEKPRAAKPGAEEPGAEAKEPATKEPSSAASPLHLPASLEAAAAAGCLRAVAAGGGRTVAVKPVAGPPVLRDLLREHFLGCALVLVRGDVDAPRVVAAAGGGWTVATAGGAVRSYTMDQLAAALRKPRPWE